MLDFRRHRRALAHPGTALERRLLTLVIGVGVVVLLMVGASDPGNWRWLAPPNPSEPSRPPAEQQVVLALSDEDDGANSLPASPETSIQGERPFFAGVRPDYLSHVRDDTVFRPAESDAWFHLFAVLEATPADELTRASEGRVGYLQLSQQPNEYRGRLVTIGGNVRAAKLVAAPQNAFGVEQYYQLWLQPDRASPELIVLYCLQLPERFPLGDELDEPCTATGLFFKRWAYASQGGVTTAPLVVAKTLEWKPAPAAATAAEPPLSERVMMAAMVAAVLAAMALVVIARRKRGAARPVAQRDVSSDASVAASLASLDEESQTDERFS